MLGHWGRLVGVCCAAAAIGAALPAAQAQAEPRCTRQVEPPGSTGTVEPQVSFETDGPANPMNMGGLRGTGMTDIAVTATPPLPESITSQDITVAVPQRFARSGTGLSSSYLPDPTFTPPQILEHGKLVAFTLCVDASRVEAGSYVGQVIVGGPRGVQPTTIAITLNAKNEGAFIIGLVIALVIAALLMLARGMSSNYVKPTSRGFKLAFASALNALEETATEWFGFWTSAVIGIVAAGVAMLQVYDSNPSWGADTISSLIALGGTAISAAGVGTFVSSMRKT